MSWVRVFACGACIGGLEQVTFGADAWIRTGALVTAILSGFLITGLTAYQWGRESAFADMQKFGRAFTRAKEP